MNRKLTLREKVLIYILCCTLIFSMAVVFLILPGLTRLSNANEKLQTAEIAKADADNAMKNRDALESQLSDLEDTVYDLSSEYYSTMEPEEADVILSGIVSRYGFTPTALEISDITPTSLAAYVPGSTAAADTTSEGGDTAATTDTVSDTTLNSYTMTIAATGTTNQFAALCGEISLNKSMHLVSYAYHEVVTEETVGSNTSFGATSGNSSNSTSTNSNKTTTNSNTTNSTTNTEDDEDTSSNSSTKSSTNSSTNSTSNSSSATTRTETTYEISLTVELFTYADADSLGDNGFNVSDDNEDKNRDTEEDTEDTESEGETTVNDNDSNATADYVLDTSTGYFHLATCSKVSSIADTNKKIYLSAKYSDMVDAGYKPCSECLD